jgi:hypothetical protein
MGGIAGDRPKTLVNLGSDEIIASQDVERLKRFVFSVHSDRASKFKQISWAKLLDPIIDTSPKWFLDFCRSRHLISTLC